MLHEAFLKGDLIEINEILVLLMFAGYGKLRVISTQV